MTTNRRLSVLFRLLLAILPILRVSVAKDELRDTPVPSNEPIPTGDFFRNPLIDDVSLNRSGSHMAGLFTNDEDRTFLVAIDLDHGTFETVGGSGDQEIGNYTWLDDRYLIAVLDYQKIYSLGLFAAKVGELSAGYPLLQYMSAELVGVPRRDRLHPLIWVRSNLERRQEDLGVARIGATMDLGGFVNLTNAESSGMDHERVRKRNARHIVSVLPRPADGVGAADYFCDKDGELAYAITAQGGRSTLHRLVGDHWERCPVDLDEFDVVAPGNRPGEIVVEPQKRTGRPFPLQFMDAATGKLGQVLVQDKAYDPDGSLYRDLNSGVVLGARFSHGAMQTTWFDPAFRAVQKEVDAAFPGHVVQIVANDEKGRFLVTTYSDREPAIFLRLDPSKHSIGLIKKSRPWIDPARMRPTSLIKFKTRDGRTLDALLTMPAGASAQHPPPLIVFPHGGPIAVDTWGFDGEVQFYAYHGYAVLQPNYRGSLGFDWMFPFGVRWDFLSMHHDVTDATKAMIASHLIDPHRVAIMGASFGAYLGLSGIVHEPELYRCAVLRSGIYDWAAELQDEKYYQYDSAYYSYLRRWLGDPKEDKAKFDAISPVRFVSAVRVPVFVSHGRRDSTVDISESKRLVSELERYHVPHETMFVSGEAHGMYYLKHRVEEADRILAFLAKNLAPESGATGAEKR